MKARWPKHITTPSLFLLATFTFIAHNSPWFPTPTSFHPFRPPIFCITIVFTFPLNDCNTQEKLKTIVMQNLHNILTAFLRSANFRYENGNNPVRKKFCQSSSLCLRDVVCYTCSIADNKSPITASKMTLKKTTVVKLLNLLFWLRVHPCNQYMYIQDTFTLYYPLQYTLVLKNSPCYTSLHFQLLGGWKSKLAWPKGP